MKFIPKFRKAAEIAIILALTNKNAFADTKINLIEAVNASQIIELNYIWDANSPLLTMNPPFRSALIENHKETDGLLPDMSFAADMMYFSGQHGAPTIDAIGHIGHKGKLYGGLDATGSDGATGLKYRGIEEYPTQKLINKAILLDIARYKSVDHLEAGYEITIEDIQGAVKKQNILLEPGISVLLRTGFGQFFDSDKDKYMGARPGIGVNAAHWLANKKIFLGGSDQLSFEVVPESGSTFPVHRIFLAENGIYIVENINLEELGEALSESGQYEFLLVLNPPRIRGASGMALNSFAIIP
ncbi:cyclase family protein [Vibrio parahaemolyticus]|nr:cyclase family protein [Vibrio parahaemolyticus]MCA6687325.1 cyclase family protein [Vibrio parahaemolyticus]MDF5581721.1 cyclase family protein [Vibrio parahaemolyticus]MDF5586678.1 cyclase family protein [Vibrio parahaemolyticus]MDG2875799.1 cyclase family protein [Vibrio parahaemolyticus]